MFTKKTEYSLKELPFEKRMDMLAEAEDFFTKQGHELSDMESLLLKAAAIAGTRESVEYRMEHKGKDKLDKKDIKELVWLILGTDFSQLLKEKNAKLEEEFYFYGWIGLSIGILKGDKKQIEGYERIKKVLSDKKE